MMSMVLFKEVDQTIIGAETVKDLFGFSSEECIGNNFSMLLTPTYRELTAQIVWECLVNKKPMLIEGQHKNENKFAMSLLVTEAQQDVSGSVLIATIFQVHLEYAFITVNKNGTIIAANSRSEKLFEKPYAELSEKNIKSIIPSIDISTFSRGIQRQYIGNGGNGKQLSLWITLETDSLGISELYNLKIEDLNPEMEMEIVMQLDDTMTITDCSRYFIYPLVGYLNKELIGQNIHDLIDAKDIDSKISLPTVNVNDNGTGARKRMKTTKLLSQISFIASPSRVMVRNKAGFLMPFNMHISEFNVKTERFSIYLKPTHTGAFKPPDEVARNFSDYAINLQVDNGECGSSTTVFSASNKITGETRAIKIINKKLIDANQKLRAIAEFNIAKTLNHINVIKYLDQFETDNYLCTVMEFGKDGSLEAYTRKKTKLTEEESHKYFSQFVDGLGCCHQNNVCHGDIKLNNAVLCDDVVKLIDFNMSKRNNEKDIETVLKRTTFCGTSLYIAPEMVLNKDYDGQKADIWSLGVCLFVMITGEYPFDSIAASLQQKISIPPTVSLSCAELLRSILAFDPKKRFTVEQIQNHPWIKDFRKMNHDSGSTSTTSAVTSMQTSADSTNRSTNTTGTTTTTIPEASTPTTNEPPKTETTKTENNNNSSDISNNNQTPTTTSTFTANADSMPTYNFTSTSTSTSTSTNHNNNTVTSTTTSSDVTGTQCNGTTNITSMNMSTDMTTLNMNMSTDMTTLNNIGSNATNNVPPVPSTV